MEKDVLLCEENELKECVEKERKEVVEQINYSSKKYSEIALELNSQLERLEARIDMLNNVFENAPKIIVESNKDILYSKEFSEYRLTFLKRKLEVVKYYLELVSVFEDEVIDCDFVKLSSISATLYNFNCSLDIANPESIFPQ